MIIKNEIISFDPVTGSVLVKYYCDQVPEGIFYNIDIPFENGIYVDEQQAQKIIESFSPKGQLERIVKLRLTKIPDYLKNKIIVKEEVNEVIVQPEITGVDPLPNL